MSDEIGFASRYPSLTTSDSVDPAIGKAIYDHSSQEHKGGFPGGADTYRQTRYKRLDEEQSYQVVYSELEQMAHTTRK